MDETTVSLKFLIRSLSRFTFYVTEEEDRALQYFHQELGQDPKTNVWVYNAVLGLIPVQQVITDWTTRAHAQNQETLSIHDALTKIYKTDTQNKRNFYIITDPDRWFRDETVVRRLINIAHQIKNNTSQLKMLVFVGNRRSIPEKLQGMINIVNDPGLSTEQIQERVEQVCKNIVVPVPKDFAPFKGLTSYQIETAITQGVIAAKDKNQSTSKTIDLDHVRVFKRNRLKQTDLISYVDTRKTTFKEVGGLHLFKEWAHKTKATWTEKGQAFGLKPPRGVLALGVWGCGKSLSVKAMSSAWHLPVIQLEMGKLRSSGVGESEANVYRAIQLIESVAPCVTGETLVTLADGKLRPIETIWQDYQDKSEPLEVMCWNERTLRVDTTKVLAVTRREAEAFKVRASNGYYLNATANHQHYVMRGGLPEWVRTDELQVGDMLAVPLKQYAGSKAYAEWPAVLGWLLGVLTGAGFVTSKNTIGLTHTSVALHDSFERVISELFNLKPNRVLNVLSETPVFKPCWTTTVQNGFAAEFLKEAKEAILAAPVAVRAAFLAGWIDASGSIKQNKISLVVKDLRVCVKHRRLARVLLQSLGIVPSRFDTAYLEITGSRAASLARIIQPHLMLKASEAKNVTSSEYGFEQHGTGFACGALLSNLQESSSTEQLLKAGLPISVFWRHKKGIARVNERQMAKYIAAFGENAKDLNTLFDAECRWVSIQDITSIGEHTVYDLACEGEDTHSFIANGLITHNCIVWIDEADKSLSGTHSSAASDAGTTARTIGILSTWVQETTSNICLALTANNVQALPVEMINRMDERFFFGLPDEDERIEILKIHIAKVADTNNYNLARLAESSVNMVGREIEQSIGAALIESFNQSKTCLDEQILDDTLKRKPRIYRTMTDNVKALTEWVGWDPDAQEGIRARFASKVKR